MYKAVLWDFGGVFTASPFAAFNRYEMEHGIPKDFIRTNNSHNIHDNAWAKMERNEISTEEFANQFERETSQLGHPINGAEILPLLAGPIRPAMVAALEIVQKGYKTACLTNNMRSGYGPSMTKNREFAADISAILDKFDYIVESSKVGVRKPESKFYKIACDLLKIVPAEAIFMDDLGINLKPARAMGMTTIKVDDSNHAITELGNLLSLRLI